MEGQDPCALKYDLCLHANDCPHDDPPPVAELPRPADPPADLPTLPARSNSQDPKCDACTDKYIECRNSGLNLAFCDNKLTSCLKEQGCSNPPTMLAMSSRGSSVDPKCDACIDKYIKCRNGGVNLALCDSGLSGCLSENGCPNPPSKRLDSVATFASDCEECNHRYQECREVVGEFVDSWFCVQVLHDCEKERGCRATPVKRQADPDLPTSELASSLERPDPVTCDDCRMTYDDCMKAKIPKDKKTCATNRAICFRYIPGGCKPKLSARASTLR